MDKRIKKIILWLFVLAFVISSQAASQFVAYKLNYQPLLDWVVYVGQEYKIYFPLAYFKWYYAYYADAPKLFSSSANIFIVVFMVLLIALLIVKSKLVNKVSNNFGSARWATKEELSKTGLLNGKGVFLGILPSGEYLRDDDSTHTLVCAPTRSGKGVGIIIPTLLYWPHSVLITDIKGENWAFTSAYRKHELKNAVIKFEPTAYDSAKFNPFEEIRIGTPKEISDTQNICQILVDPTGKGMEGSDAHWKQNAASLLQGIVIHLKYTLPDVSIKDVLKFMTEDNDGLQAYLGKILADDEAGAIVHDETGEILKYACQAPEKIYFHPYVQQIFSKMFNTPEKEFGSIASTLDTALAVYRDPVLANNVSRCDFRIKDLMNFARPVSLYLVVPPSDIDRMNPVFRVIVELVYRRNVEKMEFDIGKKDIKNNKFRLLMLMDEFPGLGKLDAFERALAYIAGYKIKAMLICQGINQLNRIYTQYNSLIDNCHVRVFHTPNDELTPKYISGLIGQETVRTKNVSYGGAVFNLGPNNVSYNETGRSLMTPDEITTMPKTDEIVFVAGNHPIMAKKITWYDNADFKDRPTPAPEKSDIIWKGAENWRQAALLNLSNIGINIEYERAAKIEKEEQEIGFDVFGDTNEDNEQDTGVNDLEY